MIIVIIQYYPREFHQTKPGLMLCPGQYQAPAYSDHTQLEVANHRI